jgi:hypothetical protein
MPKQIPALNGGGGAGRARPVAVRLADVDIERLIALADRHGTNQSGALRQAIKLGLNSLERADRKTAKR